MMGNDFQLSTADWSTDKNDLMHVRRSVFIDEQHVPEELEWDDDDLKSLHLIVRSGNKPVATARLLANGQVGRMAVLSDYRGLGIGSQMLQYFIDNFSDERKLFLHAQTQAIDFYRKFGFVTEGEEYMEAGIPHYSMVLIKP